jgi:hypothetical protein
MFKVEVTPVAMETGVIQFLQVELTNLTDKNFYHIQLLVGGSFAQLHDVNLPVLYSEHMMLTSIPIRCNENIVNQAIPGTLEIFYEDQEGNKHVWRDNFVVRVIPHLFFEHQKTINSIKVFICHSSEDKALVRDFCQRLRADGVDYWLDEEQILPGQDWQNEIHKAIHKSQAVIVCLTRNSINKVGYVQKEIKSAIDFADEHPEGHIFVIPVRFEECAIPVRLNRWQWVNYYEKDGYSKLQKTFQVLANNIKRS